MAAPPQLNHLLTPLAGPSSLVPTTSSTIPHLAQYYAATIPTSQPIVNIPKIDTGSSEATNAVSYIKKLWQEYKLLGFVILIAGIYVYWQYFYKDANKTTAPAPAKSLNFMDPQPKAPQGPQGLQGQAKKQAAGPQTMASALETDPNFTPLAK
jgi:hypothetical protein